MLSSFMSPEFPFPTPASRHVQGAERHFLSHPTTQGCHSCTRADDIDIHAPLAPFTPSWRRRRDRGMSGAIAPEKSAYSSRRRLAA
ncbi:hypothetical protein HD592_000231 [Schaalia hyovaginalis]|uniref:Uncharacterized protein n=1 Tax=Schaalia hyovaginalis TaxID=29316 RepID=A0A923IXT6_9ACTO|nr:hypothetical protein [Schaalia hyovaginalis]